MMTRMLRSTSKTSNDDDGDDAGPDQNQNSKRIESVHVPPPPNANEMRAEREERSLALEKTYVHDVYEQIAPHFKSTQQRRPWQRVNQFLMDLEPGSLVCDVGCGNGKYLGLNAEVFTLGCDQCWCIAQVAKEGNGHEVMACDNVALPFRDESFDAALSVAVVHHFATTERRVQALRELARVLRIGGRLMITVWALEQRHRKFESQDVLVPWHKPMPSSSEEQTSADKDVVSTTTSDDDQHHYHAYTSGMESEPYFVPMCQSRKKYRFKDAWVNYRSRNLDSCRSSSQSSSDLSSPNETCYSFVRRALKKLSSSRTWDDPHQRCRPPWFLQTVDSTPNLGAGAMCVGGTSTLFASSGGGHEKQDSVESNENADDIPIELHNVDSEMCGEDDDDDHQAKQQTELRKNQKNCGGDKELPVLASCLKDSSTKSHSAKCLKRSSSTDSSSTKLGLKSKSLSDLLSLFTANFLYSRKQSQDSTTSGSSTSSLARQSSSSSVDCKSATVNKKRSSKDNSGVARSRSSHSTLTKVDEGIEQLQQQQTTSSINSVTTTTTTTMTKNEMVTRRSDVGTGQQQHPRWSVAGSSIDYEQMCHGGGESGCNDKNVVRRPRSLVLGKEVRIPRTLSAEDHKNGNTILPDLDSCLSFYGLKIGGSKSDSSFLSPPYTKTELEQEQTESSKNADHHRHPSSSLTEAASLVTNDDQQLDDDSKKSSSTEFNGGLLKQDPPSDVLLLLHDRRHHHHHRNTTTRDHSLSSSSKDCRVEAPAQRDIPEATSKKRDSDHALARVRLRRDTQEEIFYSNVINQIIANEHLFPYRSMPNLILQPKKMDTDQCLRPLQHEEHNPKDFVEESADVSRRHSQPLCSVPPNMLEEDDDDDEVDQKLVVASGVMAFKKRSLSVDTGKNCESATKTCDDFQCPENSAVCRRSWLARRRSLVFGCSNRCVATRPVIRHSVSADDSTNLLKVLASSATMQNHHHHCQHLPSSQRVHVGNKIIVKEDSLQSDTSVDSDDSVASVIAVRKESVRRLASDCSKESSNLSDTSVDSEDSCISVIAMPPKLEGDETTMEEVDCYLAAHDGVASGVSESNQSFFVDPKFLHEVDLTRQPLAEEETVEADDVPPANTDEDQSNVTVSWEKYLDACESLVLDNIFYVNAAADADKDISISNLEPTFFEDYGACPVTVEYYSSLSPMTAEVCWFEGGSSSCDWQSYDDSAGGHQEQLTLSKCDPVSVPGGGEDDDGMDLFISSSLHDLRLGSPLLSTEVAFAPDSPQGRLLEAAFDVANSLQSAVTAVVGSSPGHERNPAMDVSDNVEDDDNPSECGCSLEINPLYQCTSPDKSPVFHMEFAGDPDQEDEGWRTVDVATCKESVSRCNSKDVAVETDPLPEDTVARSELKDDVTRQREDDVLNGNVPGLDTTPHCDKIVNAIDTTDACSSTSPVTCRRYSESYVTSCTAMSTIRRFSFTDSCSGRGNCGKCDNFNNLQGIFHGCLCDGAVHKMNKKSPPSSSRDKVDVVSEQNVLSKIDDDDGRAEDATKVHPMILNVPFPQQSSCNYNHNNNDKNKKSSADSDLMQTSMTSSIENHFGQLEFMSDGDKDDVKDGIGSGLRYSGGCESDKIEHSTTVAGDEQTITTWQEDNDKVQSLSLSTSEDSILSCSENGGSTTYHRYYHVFREGELDSLIDKYVENLHIISSYYDHANWCIVAEKVQVWRI